MEEVGPGWVRRPVRLARGRVVVTVRVSGGGAVVEADGGAGVVTVPVPVGSALAGATDDATGPVVHAVRRWLGLDGDPAPAAAAWASDPVLAPAVRRRPGLRVHGAVDAAELALRTVLGQQVSVAGARTLTGRLVALLGEPVSGTGGTQLLAFPDPGAVADAGVEAVRSIGLTGARATTLVGLAAALADGLDVGPGPDLAERLRTLGGLPGIGPWTVAYVALRGAAEPDAFPAHDLVLRQRLGARTPREAAAVAQAWRPWRALAAQHLWTAAALG